MQKSGQTFSNSTEFLDGNAYDNCKFENCQIVYGGGEIPRIANCQFANCQLPMAIRRRGRTHLELHATGLSRHGPGRSRARRSDAQRDSAACHLTRAGAGFVDFSGAAGPTLGRKRGLNTEAPAQADRAECIAWV